MRVRCVNNKMKFGDFTLGKEYELLKIKCLKNKYIYILRDNFGKEYGCNPLYFTEVKTELEKSEGYIPLSEQNFEALAGRKFLVTFVNPRQAQESPIRHCFGYKTIEGYLENFSPSTHVVLNGQEDGFNIIPYFCIVQMLEIKE